MKTVVSREVLSLSLEAEWLGELSTTMKYIYSVLSITVFMFPSIILKKILQVLEVNGIQVHGKSLDQVTFNINIPIIGLKNIHILSDVS